MLTGQSIEELRLHYHIIAGTHFWEEHYGHSNNAADVKTAFVIISSKAKSIALKNQVELLFMKVWMLVVCFFFFLVDLSILWSELKYQYRSRMEFVHLMQWEVDSRS